ncbi:fatty acyl-AMP ligase [Amycolatopsis magusensis]|uniref:fatty acyl-AMP ligase n=1 Tax=Amycolatopsis magusensis TaxID=882444 RepID=UPI0024A87062|nr:fatty acyl-AMP ligase [Amycolatopsis magusensis]MDI5978877.1 fatty acyl-AMP ligase [Amycolatopsis magusensis]
MAEPRTLVDLLRRRAEDDPSGFAFGFLGDGESLRRFTYGQLDGEARRIASLLAGRLAPGSRAVLVHEPGLDFVAAFFGCLYAGVVAVPVYPPMPPRADLAASRIAKVIEDVSAEALLTTAALRDHLTAQPVLTEHATGLRWTVTDQPGRGDPGAWRAGAATPDGIALVQYTSGSTTEPRGVVLRHRNLLANQAAIGEALHVPGHPVVASWLPMYHDMGLIGTILFPLYRGAPCYLMSPLRFLQRPASWLELITRYQVTVSGGPDFAYALCARRVTEAERDGLDLSSWRVAFSGAEPIRAATMRRFAETFAPSGFDAAALAGCYGLAEASLLVTGAGRADPPVLTAGSAELEAGRLVAGVAGGTRLVPSGRVASGHDVVIVDPASGTPLPDGEVGELWVRGPSVADGYWRRPADTAATFGATLSTGAGGYLRTGDLGALDGGLLYVTGRLKDLLIVRGRSIHPHDIEDTACRADPSSRRGGGAAFPVDSAAGEVVTLVQESRAEGAGLEPSAKVIRQAVLETHQLLLGTIYLVPPGSVLKTSSGKVRRRASAEAVRAGRMTVLREDHGARTGGGDRAWTATASGTG